MFIPSSQEVKSAARSALNHPAYDPKKLALIYAGVAVGFDLLITVLNYVLSMRIGTSGGISGLGARGILTTLQSLLPIISTLFLPLWDIGMLRAGMNYMRDEEVSPRILTAGFRRFGPVFRLLLLRSVMLIAILLLSVNIGSFIFSVTPWSVPLQSFAETVMESGTITEEMIAEMMPAMAPLYGITLAVFCVIAIPFFYRLRMADFILMDKSAGALSALLFSRQLMRGNRFKLFKLDLSFWWYYAISIFSIVVCYLDLILAAAGIPLPLSAEVQLFLFFGLYALIRFFLCWQSGSYINTAYAIAFDSIAPKAPENPDSPTANL